MFRHRLAPEADYYRLPAPPLPPFRPASYLLVPVAVFSLSDWVQTVYVVALEQAAETSRPALPDRLFGFWN
jgi:hypothetical protein